MKVVLLGSCQLSAAGKLINTLIQARHIDMELIWVKGWHDTHPDEIIDLFNALDQADIIYAQYVDDSHRWSTKRLKKDFHLRMIPILKSPISPLKQITPQIYMPEYIAIDYFDVRAAQMYLEGANAKEAAEQYNNFFFDEEKITEAVETSARKYEKQFSDGSLNYDYSAFYRFEMKKNLHSFFTFNHPKNVHIDWIVNTILKDCGYTAIASSNGCPELLQEWIAPIPLQQSHQQYTMRSLGVSILTAMKVFFKYFDDLDSGLMKSEFAASRWNDFAKSANHVAV